MKVGVIGLGHIGITNVAGLLKAGHAVIGLDSDAEAGRAIASDSSRFREPGIASALEEGRAAGRLMIAPAHDDVADADLIFVCVGTPGLPNGALDLSQIEAVSRELGRALRLRPEHRAAVPIVIRSTLPPGAMRRTVLPLLTESSGQAPGSRYDLVYYPEFTREGTALADYFAPARTIIGELTPNASSCLSEILKDIEAPIFRTSFEVAELTKFADNAFHALKVGFANEIGRFAMRAGIPPGEVFELFRADGKLNISPAYLRPGSAFGGPCLVKDVQALVHEIGEQQIHAPILTHICRSNDLHHAFLVDEIARRTHPKARILLVGLSFKTGSDDLRGSPLVRLAEALLDRGYDLSIHDQDVIGAEPAAALPARLGERLLVQIPQSRRWDLIVLGKPADGIAALAEAGCPVFNVNAL